MARDPVCGMEVDPKKTDFKAVYMGEVYYFCSLACKREFEKNPEHYIKHGPTGMPEGGEHGSHHGHCC